MKRFISTIVLTCVTLVCVGSGPTVTAEEDRPFSANTVQQIVDYYKNGFITEGSGEATHLGQVTVRGEVRVFGNRSTSTIRLTAANGDSIVMQSESEYDPSLGHFIGVYMVAGGTGRFAGAMGYGVIEPVPLGGGRFNVLYDGVISY